MRHSHWSRKDGAIWSFVRNDNSRTKIAVIEYGENRPVAQMLRQAEFGEVAERTCDEYMSMKYLEAIGKEELTIEKLKELLDVLHSQCRAMVQDQSEGKCYEHVEGK